MYKTAKKFPTQLVEPLCDILESALTRSLNFFSIIPLACGWYANTTTFLIQYLCVNSATAFLFSKPLSIISFPKQLCRQIMSSYKKSATARKEKLRKGFASTQPDKSQWATTKYQKP